MFKKFLFICFFCGLSIVGKSQSLMTIGEIYNYSIGDVFQWKYGGYYGPPLYEKITITDKYYSALSDTVFYKYDSYKYTPPACPSPCTFTSSMTIDMMMSYTNLNDTMGNHLGTYPADISCIDTFGYTGVWLDSTYYDGNFCNALSSRVSYLDGVLQYVDSCASYFEAAYGTDIYSKGLGHRYYYYNSCAWGGGICQENGELLYYIKGTDTCGTPIAVLENPIFVSVNPNGSPNKQIQLYPNPATNKITISELCYKLQLLDAKGLILKEAHETTDIDISDIAPGVYILKEYSSRNAPLGVQRFVKITN